MHCRYPTTLEPVTSGGSVLDAGGLFAIAAPALGVADAGAPTGCGAPVPTSGTAAGAPVEAGMLGVGAVPALPGAWALTAGLGLRSP
jgi:hypothetical protein